MYQLRFCFEFGSGVCFWSANESTEGYFQSYPITSTQLPVSKTLQKRIEFLLSWYDTFLDWDNPPDLSPWTDEADQFCTAAQEVLHLSRKQLGTEFEILDESQTSLV